MATIKNKKEYTKNYNDSHKKEHHQWYVTNKDKRQIYCKKYYKNNKEKALYHSRNSRYKRILGITAYDVEMMYKKQNGICLACGLEMKPFGTKISDSKCPCVDHCHSTKKVRAIIHRSCNMIIGQTGDDANLLRKYAEYLDRYRHE